MNIFAIRDFLDSTVNLARKTHSSKQSFTVLKSEIIRTSELKEVTEYQTPESTVLDCTKCLAVLDLEALIARRPEFVDFLQQWPHQDRLQHGLNEQEVSDALGGQGYALKFFAVGNALDLWTIQSQPDIENLWVTGINPFNY